MHACIPVILSTVASAYSHAEKLKGLMENPIDALPLLLTILHYHSEGNAIYHHDKLRLLRNAVMAEEYHQVIRANQCM
jgi:hypothetical protein